MAGTMTGIPPNRCAANTRRLALVLADANWFTTEHLFSAVSSPDVDTLLLKCIDYQNAWRRGQRPWQWRGRIVQSGPRHWMRELVLPSGWMKQFPRWGMKPIARVISDWHQHQTRESGLALVITYPHYLYLRDQVRPDLLVYYNIDDYTHYWPRHASRLQELELQAVKQAHLTLCASRRRCDLLSEAVPEAAHRIRHLPHGAAAPFMADQPWNKPSQTPPDLAHLPRPFLGYIGSLEDRVDWQLLTRLADAFPHASLLLIGRAKHGFRAGWRKDLARCLDRPNVHALGWRDQNTLGRYISTLDVCLVPYLADHPFNLASCPTKIMDYMGSGRPIVSTGLPECRLYRHLFHVAESTNDYMSAVQSIIDSNSDDGRSHLRHAHALDNSCHRVAQRLLDWLPPVPS